MTTRKTPLIASSAILFLSDSKISNASFSYSTRGIFLTVTAQADAGLEVIHHVEMVDPLTIDDRQQEIALFDDAQNLRRYLGLLRLVRLSCALVQHAPDLLAILPRQIVDRKVTLDREDQLERVDHLVEIPLAWVGILGCVLRDGFVDFCF